MLFQLVAFLFFVLSLVVAFLSLIVVAAFMELVSPSFWFSHITMGVFTFGSFYLCGLVWYISSSNLHWTALQSALDCIAIAFYYYLYSNILFFFLFSFFLFLRFLLKSLRSSGLGPWCTGLMKKTLISYLSVRTRTTPPRWSCLRWFRWTLFIFFSWTSWLCWIWARLTSCFGGVSASMQLRSWGWFWLSACLWYVNTNCFSFSFLFLFFFFSFSFLFFFFSFSFLFLFLSFLSLFKLFLFFHLQYFTNYKVNSMIAGVFYLLWTLVPLLIGMDLAIRMLPGMTPQLGRLGVANNSVVPGINFALNVGLILFLTISKIFKISRFISFSSFKVKKKIIFFSSFPLISPTDSNYPSRRESLEDVLCGAYYDHHFLCSGVVCVRALHARNPSTCWRATLHRAPIWEPEDHLQDHAGCSKHGSTAWCHERNGGVLDWVDRLRLSFLWLPTSSWKVSRSDVSWTLFHFIFLFWMQRGDIVFFFFLCVSLVEFSQDSQLRQWVLKMWRTMKRRMCSLW